MPPEGYYDWWDNLMDEYDVPMGTTTGRYASTERSPYDNGNVIVGEIVEEGDNVQLPEIGA